MRPDCNIRSYYCMGGVQPLACWPANARFSGAGRRKRRLAKVAGFDNRCQGAHSLDLFPKSEQ
jgi:hypothetical protein